MNQSQKDYVIQRLMQIAEVTAKDNMRSKPQEILSLVQDLIREVSSFDTTTYDRGFSYKVEVRGAETHIFRSLDDVAALVGLTPTAVYQRLRRGKGSLVILSHDRIVSVSRLEEAEPGPHLFTSDPSQI